MSYQKLSDIEHVLEAPDMYVGSLDILKEKQWVLNNENKFELKTLMYAPALYKIYDEILVNAHDQYIKHPNEIKNIKVNYNENDGSISIYNDGRGFDIYFDDEHKMYSVQLVLTETKAGGNFGNKEKITGGRYGLGAKLTAIFSSKLSVETVDATRKLKYIQEYQMGDKELNISKPIITKYNGKPYTRITFIPNYKCFGMNKLEGDIIKLLEKRAWDISACTNSGVKVYINDKLIPVRSLKDYTGLYLTNNNYVYEECNDRWEICVADSNYDEMMQVSFVNGINTYQGGTHVDYILGHIIKKLKNKLVEKNQKYRVITPNMIKNNVFIFIKSIINDPHFSSQTKEKLEYHPNKFGSKCTISDDTINKIYSKLDIMRKTIGQLKTKEDLQLDKISGKKSNKIHDVEKLVDASRAGGAQSDKCVLIITEGNSAKAMAMAGRSVRDSSYIGVYPVRGKFLNVRTATKLKIQNNAELRDLLKIIGLQFGKIYTSTNELRYGKLLIFADADVDGSHIKGLLINFIHTYWPELTRIKGFISTLGTPILKVTHNRNKNVIEFFSDGEYQKWKSTLGDNQLKEWKIKYYKGLGTSDQTEARDYFRRYDELLTLISNNSKIDDAYINLAFGNSKDFANKRKKWLEKYDPFHTIDNSKKLITFKEFVDQELKHFSTANNNRVIPSAIDGLKTSQRKIMYTMFTQKITDEIKVSQLSGTVSKLSAYHHGEDNLIETITGLGQNYMGSNNMQLIHPQGMFGTRLEGGKDSASGRYLTTYLEKITRFIYNSFDDAIVPYLIEEGKSIEPIYYVPIIPMVLCNGANGIGTGYSTQVPNYNPRDIINNIERYINEEKLVGMKPWYRFFQGKILKMNANQFLIKGVYKIIKENIISITELPVGTWTECYKKNILDNLLVSNKESKNPIIKDFEEKNTDVSVEFIIKLVPSIYTKLKKEKIVDGIDGFEREFKLCNSVRTTNMHLFNKDNKITKYASPLKIIEDFCEVRLDYYEKRKKYILHELKTQIIELKNKVKFIKGIINEEIIIKKKPKSDIVKMLEDYGLDKLETDWNGYGYLMKLPMYSMTLEKITILKNEFENNLNKYNELKNKTARVLWKEDLDFLKKEYDIFEKNSNDKFNELISKPK